MHELGLAQEIVEIIAERAAEKKVKRVILEIGKLSCVLPDSIRFCFDLCAEGTIAEGAELEILQPPGRGLCRRCGAQFPLDSLLGRCACGSSDVDWAGGEELKLKAVEIA
jgi:hydrogenase nickel incorporation protein HypA/HybF